MAEVTTATAPEAQLGTMLSCFAEESARLHPERGTMKMRVQTASPKQMGSRASGISGCHNPLAGYDRLADFADSGQGLTLNLIIYWHDRKEGRSNLTIGVDKRPPKRVDLCVVG